DRYTLLCLPHVPRQALPSFPHDALPILNRTWATPICSHLMILQACALTVVVLGKSWASTWRLPLIEPSRSTKAHCGCPITKVIRSEEHTSELQSRFDLVCRLLLEKKKTA